MNNSDLANSYEGLRALENGAYRAIKDWVSISELNLMRVAPLVYEERILKGNKTESTGAQLDGTAIHAATLEQNTFLAQYGALPPGDYRTGRMKKLRAALEAAEPSKTFVSQKDLERFAECACRIHNHKSAGPLLDGTENELSYFWIDPVTGVKCKARADAIHRSKFYVADLKTTKNAKKFQDSIVSWGYHRQAAYYLDGLSKITGVEWKDWYWIVAEVYSPHLIRVFKASQALLEQGRHEYREDLKAMKACQASGVYPGLEDGVEEISLPYSYMKRHQPDTFTYVPGQ